MSGPDFSDRRLNAAVAAILGRDVICTECGATAGTYYRKCQHLRTPAIITIERRPGVLTAIATDGMCEGFAAHETARRAAERRVARPEVQPEVPT